MTKVDPIPKGYHTITAGLTVTDARGAMEFYKKAFGAEEKQVCMSHDGKQIMHGELLIGNSILMINDEITKCGCASPKTLGGSSAALYVYVENVDEVFDRAVKAGAEVNMPVTDQFWGDRSGQIVDPYGHKWTIATHVADPTPEQIRKAAEEWSRKNMACAKK
jgi:PhnB protein